MSNDITELRSNLFDTLRGLKDGSMEIDRARAIADIAKTITDTAKVEVDFMRVAGGNGTGFIATAQVKQISATPNGIKTVDGNITRHVMGG